VFGGTGLGEYEMFERRLPSSTVGSRALLTAIWRMRHRLAVWPDSCRRRLSLSTWSWRLCPDPPWPSSLRRFRFPDAHGASTPGCERLIAGWANFEQKPDCRASGRSPQTGRRPPQVGRSRLKPSNAFLAVSAIGLLVCGVGSGWNRGFRAAIGSRRGGWCGCGKLLSLRVLPDF